MTQLPIKLQEDSPHATYKRYCAVCPLGTLFVSAMASLADLGYTPDQIAAFTYEGITLSWLYHQHASLGARTEK